jgi:hypothetical protein
MSPRRGRAWTAVALAAALSACGSDTGTEPTPGVRRQIAGGTFNVEGTVVANGLGFNADIAAGRLTVAEAGTVEITADWTSAANNIDIFFYVGSCSSEQARNNACEIANRTTSATTKPERLTIRGVPAGNYSLGFANFGPTAETGSFEAFLTP